MSKADAILSRSGNTPCYPTFKAYTEYAGPLIDDYHQVAAFKFYLPFLLHWQNCCPDGRVLIERARPHTTVLPSLEQIPVPPVFGTEAPCDTSYFRDRWQQEYSPERKQYWERNFEELRERLHACCTAQFNACLEEAAEAQPGAPTQAAAECLKRFDPSKQLQTTDPLASDCDRRIAAAKTVWQEDAQGLSPFPAGPVSGLEPLAWGIAVLAAAFLIGAAGRQQKRLLAGGIGALIAGVVFFGSLMVLPASGRMGLLSATVSSLLLVTLRSLFRALYLLRHRRIPSP